MHSALLEIQLTAATAAVHVEKLVELVAAVADCTSFVVPVGDVQTAKRSSEHTIPATFACYLAGTLQPEPELAVVVEVVGC